MDPKSLSIYVANYKCFGPERQGFEVIRNINILIGRNNCGKSALIDVVGFVVGRPGGNIPSKYFHKGTAAEVIIAGALDINDVNAVFVPGTLGGDIPGRNREEFGKRLLGCKLTKRHWAKDLEAFVAIGPNLNGEKPLDSILRGGGSNYARDLADRMTSPWASRRFFRVSAERNVVAEVDTPISPDGLSDVAGDGTGLTNLVQNYQNHDSLQEELVRSYLLSAVNRVMRPDAEFTEILVQKLEAKKKRPAAAGGAVAGEGADNEGPQDKWEIFLRTTGGRFALSKCGSGLKTVLLVLAYFHVVLKVDQEGGAERAKGVIYAFEELENCLHPALLRRLLDYLDDLARRHDLTMFFTTHSNVMIDRFAGRDQAQIVHVTQVNGVSSVKRADSWTGGNEILDDLGCRASDLLQANGIIWVEGPSDRIYINKWIELHSGGLLHEGRHYQCVFYGGKLLSHLDGSAPSSEEDDLVSLLTINRNMAIVMDSDLRDSNSTINGTKQRVQSQVERIGGLAWVTRGREIENYLEPGILSEATGCKVTGVSLFESAFDALEAASPGARSKWTSQKPKLAREAAKLMTKESALGVLDLHERIDGLCRKIGEWNGIAAANAADGEPATGTR